MSFGMGIILIILVLISYGIGHCRGFAIGYAKGALKTIHTFEQADITMPEGLYVEINYEEFGREIIETMLFDSKS